MSKTGVGSVGVVKREAIESRAGMWFSPLGLSVFRKSRDWKRLIPSGPTDRVLLFGVGIKSLRFGRRSRGSVPEVGQTHTQCPPTPRVPLQFPTFSPVVFKMSVGAGTPPSLVLCDSRICRLKLRVLSQLHPRRVR